MGFFSWRCAKSGKPILAGSVGWPDDLRHLADVVLVLPGGTVSGRYDGYGHLDGARGKGARGMDEVAGTAEEEGVEYVAKTVKLVLASEYAGERYDDLPPSRHEPYQGYFWDVDDLRDVVAGRMEYGAGLFSPPSEEQTALWTALGAAALRREAAGGPALAALEASAVRGEAGRKAALADLARVLSGLDAAGDEAAKAEARALRFLRSRLKGAPVAVPDRAPPLGGAPAEVDCGAFSARVSVLAADGDVVVAILDGSGDEVCGDRLYADLAEDEVHDGPAPGPAAVPDGGLLAFAVGPAFVVVSRNGEEVHFEVVDKAGGEFRRGREVATWSADRVRRAAEERGAAPGWR